MLSGQPGLQATRWESVSGGWLDGSPSYAAGLTRGSVLASEQEWRIRAVLAGRGSDVPVDEVLDRDEVAGRAMAMIRGWASDGLTRYDGDVSGHGIPGPADAGQVVSPPRWKNGHAARTPTSCGGCCELSRPVHQKSWSTSARWRRAA